MNLKKLLAGVTAAAVVVNSALSVVSFAPIVGAASVMEDKEFVDAVTWAFENGLSKFNSPEAFMPYDLITREQFAKFSAAFGVTNLCLEPDAMAACDFSDIPADPTLDEYVVLACQLGLVKGFDGKFAPTASIKKSEVLTILSRALSAVAGQDAPSETGVNPRWAEHFSAMRAAGITKETDVYAVDRPVTRYEALLMLYRARDEEATCGDIDLSDLLDDLFNGDDTDDGDDMDDEEDDDDNGTVEASDGTVEVSLSSDTPNGGSVPGNASVTIAKFDFCATEDDVSVGNVTLTRYGIGSDDVVDNVALFLEDGRRLTNAKSFNSEDMAQLSVKPRLNVPADECVTVEVVAQIGDSDYVSNEEFEIGIDAAVDVNTNGAVDGDFPVRANEFEVAGVDAPTVEITPDGKLSNVELGQEGVEVADFEIENTDSEGSVSITSITFTDGESNAEDALENFVLECDNQEVDTVETVADELLTFSFPEGVEVDEGQTVDCVVLADVVGQPGETVSFYIDEELDVRGEDDQFGVGVDVNVSGYPEGSQDVDIVDGELTIVEQNIDADEIKENDDDVVLGDFKVIVNAGADLFIEDINFDLNRTAGAQTGALDTIFENFELFDVTNNTRYDLEVGTCSNTTCALGEENIDLFLPDGGEVQFQVRADTRTTFPAGVANEVSVQLTLDANPNNSDLVIKEDDDDQRLTDITPSNITFDTIDLVTSTIEVNGVNLTSVDVVVGAENVDLVMFEVETDDVSSAFINGFTFDISGSGDSDHISAVRLWKKVTGGRELIDEEGGFDIAANGEINFENFDEIEIEPSSSQLFLVTVDIVDDDNIAGDSFEGSVTDIEADDEDNDDLPAPGLPVDSNRTVSIIGAGELAIEADTSDSETDRPRHALGGVESDFVASFEFTANDEAVEIEDLYLQMSGDTGNFSDAILEVVFYDDDKTTEIYRETVSSNVETVNGYSGVRLNDFNYTVEEGSTNIYVAIVPDEIGDNRNGVQTDDIRFALFVDSTDAQGVDSDDDLTGDVQSDESLAFDVIPVHISNLEVSTKDENGTTVVDGELNSTTEKLAVVNITANSWNNTKPSGSDAEIAIDTLTLNVSTSSLSGVAASDFRLRRLNDSSESALTGASFAGGLLTFNLDAGWANDNILDSSEEVSYVVEFNNVSFSLTDGSVSIEFDEGDGSEIVYYDSTYDIGAGECDAEYNCGPIDELRFNGTFLGSVSVADNN